MSVLTVKEYLVASPSNNGLSNSSERERERERELKLFTLQTITCIILINY